MNYIDLQLTAINRKATKEKVEKELEKYRRLLLTEELDNLPVITSNYTLVPPSKTNHFYSSTESAAISMVDYQVERQKFINKILKAVNRLGYKERTIIIKRYMTTEQLFDYEIYNELHMAERTYRRYKSAAIYSLAFALKLVVYEDDKEVEGA